MSAAGRENISPVILAQTEMISICTQQQRVIASENLAAWEGYESTNGANDVILLPENVNQIMVLWIKNTPPAERQHPGDFPSKPSDPRVIK